MAASVIWDRLSKVVKSIRYFKENKVFVGRIVLLVLAYILISFGKKKLACFVELQDGWVCFMPRVPGRCPQSFHDV